MSKLYYYVMSALNSKDSIFHLEGHWPNQVLIGRLCNSNLQLRKTSGNSAVWIKNTDASPPNYMTCLTDNISWWQWFKLHWKLDDIISKLKEENYYKKRIEEKTQFEKFQERAFNESSV